ncbi:MAG: DUF5119 domain-containing protein [Prevotellaceae bacterium]|jgi:hypothetical protein|nr:DUF5119 domain-containing protein [Prevotellaceae bacterium]
MKNVKIHKSIVIILLIASVLAIDACTRRTLEEEYLETALIPVCIDWSISGASLERMHRASVWLFPLNGNAPLEFRLERDLTYQEISVPIGTYSVLVFNETVEANDWDAIVFSGTNRYETFAAMGISDAVRGFYTRSEDLPLLKNPDPLAAWSLNRFEVTLEMLNRTREIVRSYSPSYRDMLISEVPDLTIVKPLPRFERIQITAYVTNLYSSMQVTGTIDGMAAGVYMVSGEMVPASAAHAFILNARVYDNNEKDGTTTRTFNIFGRLHGLTTQHLMNLDFLLVDGTLHPREEFDVTQLLITRTDLIVNTHIINVGYDNNNGDHLIELPDMGMGAGISVDGWDEIVIPLQ